MATSRGAPLILPSLIPIADRRVQFELTRYLADNWPPVIEKDVDGPSALPLQLDGDIPNLGKFKACVRVARTIYLGSAPTATAANRGVEDRRVKLGCVMPGESPAVFGDALRRLAGAATYLYQDGPRFWYSTQPTVTKLADDKAEQLKRNPDAVARELEARVRKDVQRIGDFSRVHPLPQGPQDVPDDLDARLVVLGIDHPCSKEAGNAAEVLAKNILESRGTAPRLYRNTLVFLAIDKTKAAGPRRGDPQVPRLGLDCRREGAARPLPAPSQAGPDPAECSRRRGHSAPAGGVPVAPHTDPGLAAGNRRVAERAAKRRPRCARGAGEQEAPERWSPRHDLRVIESSARVDRVPLWRSDHVAIKQLVEDFGRYVYLQRI